MQTFIDTGVPLLEASLGGFLSGRAYVIAGEPGCGKSLLGLYFLAAGIRRGEPGLLLTQEPPADLLEQAASMGLGLEASVEDGSLILLEYDRDITGTILRYGWKPLLDQLREFKDTNRVRRVVFDTIFPLFVANMEEARLRSDTRYVSDFMREAEWTALLLTDRDSLKGHVCLERALGEVCGGMIELVDVDGAEGSDHELVCKKLRHARRGPRTVRYHIETKVGFVMSPGVASPKAASKPRLLLGSIDPFLGRILHRRLEAVGSVTLVDDAEGVIAEAIRMKPAVIVVDRRRLGGEFDLVRRTLDRAGVNSPMVALTANETRIDLLEGEIRAAIDRAPAPVPGGEVAAGRSAWAKRVCRSDRSTRRALDVLCSRAKRYETSVGALAIDGIGDLSVEDVRTLLEPHVPAVEIVGALSGEVVLVAMCDVARGDIERLLREVVPAWGIGRHGTPRAAMWCLEPGSGHAAPFLWDALQEFVSDGVSLIEESYAKTGTED
jgi:KaiC/GvpD/RAD55 family RecA-like ATPase